MKSFKPLVIVLGITCFFTACTGCSDTVSLYIDNATEEEVVLSYLQYHANSETNKAILSNNDFQQSDILNLDVIKLPGEIGHSRFWGCEYGSFWGGGLKW